MKMFVYTSVPTLNFRHNGKSSIVLFLLIELESSLTGEALLTPTRIYVKSVLPALRSGRVKAVAHITGGGLPGNVNRVLPAGLGVDLNAASWEMPPLFGWLQAKVGLIEDLK